MVTTRTGRSAPAALTASADSDDLSAIGGTDHSRRPMQQTPGNESSTEPKPFVGYIEDTRIRAPGNRRSERLRPRGSRAIGERTERHRPRGREALHSRHRSVGDRLHHGEPSSSAPVSFAAIRRDTTRGPAFLRTRRRGPRSSTPEGGRCRSGLRRRDIRSAWASARPTALGYRLKPPLGAERPSAEAVEPARPAPATRPAPQVLWLTHLKRVHCPY